MKLCEICVRIHNAKADGKNHIHNNGNKIMSNEQWTGKWNRVNRENKNKTSDGRWLWIEMRAERQWQKWLLVINHNIVAYLNFRQNSFKFEKRCCGVCRRYLHYVSRMFLYWRNAIYCFYYKKCEHLIEIKDYRNALPKI